MNCLQTDHVCIQFIHFSKLCNEYFVQRNLYVYTNCGHQAFCQVGTTVTNYTNQRILRRRRRERKHLMRIRLVSDSIVYECHDSQPSNTGPQKQPHLNPPFGGLLTIADPGSIKPSPSLRFHPNIPIGLLVLLKTARGSCTNSSDPSYSCSPVLT